LPFCRYRPVQADAGLPAWSSLPTELELTATHYSISLVFSRTPVQPLKINRAAMFAKKVPLHLFLRLSRTGNSFLVNVPLIMRAKFEDINIRSF
jgi:hypothetical protein